MVESSTLSKTKNLFVLDYRALLEDRTTHNIFTYDSDSEMYFGIQVRNASYGISDLELSSVTIRIFDDGILVDTENIVSTVYYSDFDKLHYYTYYSGLTMDEKDKDFTFEVTIVDNLGISITYTFGF